MKVLVTGATGGLGELVISNLLSKNIQVIATSRYGEKAKLCPFYSKVTYLPYSISEENTPNLYDYFQKPDLLIHLAWDKLNEYKNEAHLNQILKSHKDFLNNLLKNGLNNLTVIGTVYEYGLQEGELEESLPSIPIMPYPEAKNELRMYLEQLKPYLNFSFKWLRVFYVFGAIKERRNLYTALVQAINQKDEVFNMSGGEQIRDFLSPEEIAANIVAVAIQTKVDGIINCCSGKPVIVKELVNVFFESHHYHPKINYGFYPYPDYEPMVSWGSNTKLIRALSGK